MQSARELWFPGTAQGSAGIKVITKIKTRHRPQIMNGEGEEISKIHPSLYMMMYIVKMPKIR